MKIIILVSIILLTSLSFERKIRTIDIKRIEDLKTSINKVEFDKNASSDLIRRVNIIKEKLIEKLNEKTFYDVMRQYTDLGFLTFNNHKFNKDEILTNLETSLGIESHTLKRIGSSIDALENLR